MQVLHRVNRAFLRPSEINSQMISDVIIENEIYLLQEYFYPLHRFTRPQKILKEFFGWFTGPPPHGQSPWGGIFAKPTKCESVLSSWAQSKVRRNSGWRGSGFGKDKFVGAYAPGHQICLDPRSRNARFRLRSITYGAVPQRNLTTLRMTKAFGFCLIIH